MKRYLITVILLFSYITFSNAQTPPIEAPSFIQFEATPLNEGNIKGVLDSGYLDSCTETNERVLALTYPEGDMTLNSAFKKNECVISIQERFNDFGDDYVFPYSDNCPIDLLRSIDWVYTESGLTRVNPPSEVLSLCDQSAAQEFNYSLPADESLIIAQKPIFASCDKDVNLNYTQLEQTIKFEQKIEDQKCKVDTLIEDAAGKERYECLFNIFQDERFDSSADELKALIANNCTFVPDQEPEPEPEPPRNIFDFFWGLLMQLFKVLFG